MRIDINCDLGGSSINYLINNDLKFIKHITLVDATLHLIFAGLTNSPPKQIINNSSLTSANTSLSSKKHKEDNSLTPRARINAVLLFLIECASQMKNINLKGRWQPIDSRAASDKTNTICVHRENQQTQRFVQGLYRFPLHKEANLSPFPIILNKSDD